PTILMEQVLIQHKVPFDIIFDELADSFGRYQAVILPGQESLSREIIDRLADYAEKGGTVVFTGNTADYNQWRERRQVNPLLELMGLTGLPSEVAVRQLGKGRLVCIPRIVPNLPGQDRGRADIDAEDRFVRDATSSGGRPFPSSMWLLPVNHLEIRSAIVGGLPHSPSIETGAPLTTVLELLNREKTRETIVHFVNFERQKELGPFRVELKKQYRSKVRSVSLVSPESDLPQELEFTENGDRVVLTVPGMQLYTMVVVAY
ncbi:MAG: beta-galactosidase trimerization domain-containing protein, partial [Candidatus Glassbacteria bacterium]|nr:beta-galactosidase trimerization domain-containing protein [Candidatus Glassbacteria bacterium]